MGVTRGFAAASAAMLAVLALSTAPAAGQGAQSAPATPPEMVASYNTFADAILAVKRTEADLVRSDSFAATYAHAEGAARTCPARDRQQRCGRRAGGCRGAGRRRRAPRHGRRCIGRARAQAAD